MYSFGINAVSLRVLAVRIRVHQMSFDKMGYEHHFDAIGPVLLPKRLMQTHSWNHIALHSHAQPYYSNGILLHLPLLPLNLVFLRFSLHSSQYHFAVAQVSHARTHPPVNMTSA